MTGFVVQGHMYIYWFLTDRLTQKTGVMAAENVALALHINLHFKIHLNRTIIFELNVLYFDQIHAVFVHIGDFFQKYVKLEQQLMFSYF